jgi:hypothetical protein
VTIEAERCTAQSSRSGKRCGKLSVLGSTVCENHGGSAPQVRQAAREAVERAEARARHPRASEAEIAAELLHDHHYAYTRAKASYDADETDENRAVMNDERFQLERFLFVVKRKTDWLSLPSGQRSAIIDIWLREAEEDLAAIEARATPRALPAAPQVTLEGEWVS